MATRTRASDAAAATTTWGDDKITIAQAAEFAQLVSATRADRETIARNLQLFPGQIKVRGIFFEGLSRIVGGMNGTDAMAAMVQRAGVAAKTTAFRAYPHRDFYKLYYLAARQLYPGATTPEALRLTARTFFPIFKDSLLGRTMSALMGDRPTTLLPLLAKAYNLSVEGNDHRAELDGGNALVWKCEVEPVEWYVDTFTGIIEGAMPPRLTAQVRLEERSFAGGLARYQFRIGW
jgi:uncharacterized protein (TIGR02265 family)